LFSAVELMGRSEGLLEATELDSLADLLTDRFPDMGGAVRERSYLGIQQRIRVLA